MLDLIRGTLYLFVVIVITYYAGVLVWKDRDERMDEIADSTPTPEWMSYASRLLTLILMVMLMQTAALLGGVAVQAWHHYHRYQIGLYLYELLVRDASGFLFLGVLAFLIHALSPNKYVGYFFYIAFIAANTFMWRPSECSHQPGAVCRHAQRCPFRHVWRRALSTVLELVHALLAAIFCGLLAILTVMFWPRGKQDRWRGVAATLRCVFTVAGYRLQHFACWCSPCTGGWIWYNTAVLNRLVGPKTAAETPGRIRESVQAV